MLFIDGRKNPTYDKNYIVMVYINYIQEEIYKH